MSRRISLSIALLCAAGYVAGASALPAREHAPITLQGIYNQITDGGQTQDPYIKDTISLSHGNKLADNFLIEYPGNQMWGKAPEQIPTYGFDSKQGDSDFGLPACNNLGDIDPNEGGTCTHLHAFYNGERGQDSKMYVGMADHNLDRIYDTITKAKHFVDITTLSNFPDRRFLATIRNALTYLAYSGRPVTVRMLDGYYSPKYQITVQQPQPAQMSWSPWKDYADKYVRSLIRDLKGVQGSQLKLFVASTRTCLGLPGSPCSSQAPEPLMRFSWNHSKIIDVDGQEVLSGGVNMFATTYLEKMPKLDLMADIQGPAAANTLNFTNMLWRFVNDHLGYSVDDMSHVVEYAYQPSSGIVHNSPAPMFKAAAQKAPGDVTILNVGRTGGGIAPDGQRVNSSDKALYLMMNHAQKSIYIAQQSLSFTLSSWPPNLPFPKQPVWGGNVFAAQPHSNFMSALASAINRGVDVNIVTSPYSINPANAYASMAAPKKVWAKLQAEAESLPGYNEADFTAKLCQHFKLKFVSFDGQDSWGSASHWNKGKPWIYDHYKFIFVDGHRFYIGSQNFYPSGLQNYGYITDNASAGSMVQKKFWAPLWKNSLPQAFATCSE